MCLPALKTFGFLAFLNLPWTPHMCTHTPSKGQSLWPKAGFIRESFLHKCEHGSLLGMQHLRHYQDLQVIHAHVKAREALGQTPEGITWVVSVHSREKFWFWLLTKSYSWDRWVGMKVGSVPCCGLKPFQKIHQLGICSSKIVIKPFYTSILGIYQLHI